MTGAGRDAPPIERAIRAIFSLESDDELFTPECVAWHNFDKLEVPINPNAWDSMRWAHTIAPDIHISDITSYVISAEVSVLKYVLRATLPQGEKVHTPIVAFGFSLDGRVFRIEEYLDSAQSPSMFARYALES